MKQYDETFLLLSTIIIYKLSKQFNRRQTNTLKSEKYLNTDLKAVEKIHVRLVIYLLN